MKIKSNKWLAIIDLKMSAEIGIEATSVLFILKYFQDNNFDLQDFDSQIESIAYFTKLNIWKIRDIFKELQKNKYIKQHNSCDKNSKYILCRD